MTFEPSASQAQIDARQHAFDNQPDPATLVSREEIRAALVRSLEGRKPRKTLLIPPDYTRYHSNAGYITNVYYHLLTEAGCAVDVLPAPVLWALASLQLSLAGGVQLLRHARSPECLRPALVLGIAAAVLHGLGLAVGFWFA